MKKPFEDWLWEDLEIEFGLGQTALPELDAWLDNQAIVTDKEKEQLDILSIAFNARYEDWNEDEVKMQFIAPLLSIVNYHSPLFSPFSQRNLSAVIGKWELYGRVDWVLAQGKQTPRKPYMFVHEYKAEKGRTNDPKGQLLAEMLVAQTKNADGKCIFGAYVVGKDWTFMVLKDKNYAVSRPYQANEAPDFNVIFKALKEIKNILKI